MAVEQQIYTVLSAVCERTFPDAAPIATEKPYITWQISGGSSWRYLDNSPTDKRQSVVVVNVWHGSRRDALELIRAVEEAMCAPSAPFVAKPNAEPNSVPPEEDLGLYGATQDFMVVSSR